MKQKLLKALLVLDRRENSWLLNGGFHESIDCQLMDVKGLGVDVGHISPSLRVLEAQRPDVLLLDSTLPWQFASQIVMRLREKMPHLPIVLLPNIHDAGDGVSLPATLHGMESPSSPEPQSDDEAADSILRIIRYVDGRLGLQRTLLQMALRDELTGLHNRRGFTALATQHLRWARDKGQHSLMFFADLDGLKRINDEFGHDEGDRALALAAACIQRTFRKSDVTGRLSGDEFVAMMFEEPGRGPEAIQQRLQANLADRASAERRYKLSLSVGVARFDPAKPVSLQELMRRADADLYRHKRNEPPSVSVAVAAASRHTQTRDRGSVSRPTLDELPLGSY